MSSVELQKLTASEPLSLEEEYQMQKSWIEDQDSNWIVQPLLYEHHISHPFSVCYRMYVHCTRQRNIPANKQWRRYVYFITILPELKEKDNKLVVK